MHVCKSFTLGFFPLFQIVICLTWIITTESKIKSDISLLEREKKWPSPYFSQKHLRYNCPHVSNYVREKTKEREKKGKERQIDCQKRKRKQRQRRMKDRKKGKDREKETNDLTEERQIEKSKRKGKEKRKND